MEERRRDVRVNSAVQVNHRVRGSIMGGSVVTEDISRSGVSFPTFQKLEPGILLNLDITLPGFKTVINTAGKVVWRRGSPALKEKFLVGAEFTNIDAVDQNRLGDYIRSVTVKPGI